MKKRNNRYNSPFHFHNMLNIKYFIFSCSEISPGSKIFTNGLPGSNAMIELKEYRYEMTKRVSFGLAKGLLYLTFFFIFIFFL